MAGTIVVGIPEKCYISSDPAREFPFEFYFHITYGTVPKENRIKFKSLNTETIEAIAYPQITVGGFEQLLSENKIDDFISNLKKTGDDDWIIKKSSTSSNILFQYTGDMLSPDFSFRAATEKFISTAEKNNLVTLTVSVKNFENIENTEYIIHTKVDYTPWAKSLTSPQTAVAYNAQIDIFYECMGDNVDKQLYQNGKKLDSARSPYTATMDAPSLFKLDVFNQDGMNDETQLSIDILPPKILSFTAEKNTFSAGESLQLTWQVESVSDLTIEGFNPQTDTITGNTARVYPIPSLNERTKRYTLRASGYKEKRPYSTSAEVLLYQTNWSNTGAVNGFFSPEAFSNTNYNSRIFTVDDQYYCYAHPTLYKSPDGYYWKPFSQNDKSDPSFLCIAADCYAGVLYAMGKNGQDGDTLFISEFDFKSSVWSFSAAAQTCSSAIAGFAFSQNSKQYAQVVPKGMSIVERGDDGEWNAGTTILLAYSGTTAVSGDYCFYKNRNYAVLLCDNNSIYVYDCDESMEQVLFMKDIKKKVKFVSFVQTINNLYIMAGDVLVDVKTQEIVDPFSPPCNAMTNRPWLGANKANHLFGVYPDLNLWILDE